MEQPFIAAAHGDEAGIFQLVFGRAGHRFVEVGHDFEDGLEILIGGVQLIVQSRRADENDLDVQGNRFWLQRAGQGARAGDRIVRPDRGFDQGPFQGVPGAILSE